MAKQKTIKRETDNGSNTYIYTARLNEAQAVALKEIQDKVGIPISVQMRRAVELWLASQGGK